MPDRLEDLAGPELTRLMRRAAAGVSSVMPEGTLFVLVATDPERDDDPPGGFAQYVSNADRPSIVAILREMADRLERRETLERVPLEGPAYACPRCGSVSHHPEDVRHKYCAHCRRFQGLDEDPS